MYWTIYTLFFLLNIQNLLWKGILYNVPTDLTTDLVKNQVERGWKVGCSLPAIPYLASPISQLNFSNLLLLKSFGGALLFGVE